MYYYLRPLLLSGVLNFNCLFSVQTVNTCQSTQYSLGLLQARDVHSLLTAVSKRLSLKRLHRLLSTSAPVLKRRSTGAVVHWMLWQCCTSWIALLLLDVCPTSVHLCHCHNMFLRAGICIGEVKEIIWTLCTVLHTDTDTELIAK